MTIHQLVPTFEPGAIGDHIVALHQLLTELGHESVVFADHVRPGMPAISRSYHDYGRAVRASAGDHLLYHVSIGSPAADFLLEQSAHVVIDHHSMTPASFLMPWEPAVAQAVQWGHRQLAALATVAVAGLADSEFNRRDLVSLGCSRTAVAPILFDPARLGGPGAAHTTRHVGATWLFVGRLAPNKCQHDLVKAFAVYRRAYDDEARLRIVGRPGTAPGYDAALQSFVEALGLGPGVIEITGEVSDDAMAGEYERADVFVSVSEHEGFLVPLLESMSHGLPVVAFDAGAVGETLGRGGLLLRRKDPAFVAAAVHRVLTDDVAHAGLVAAGQARLDDFDLETSRARWRTCIEELLV